MRERALDLLRTGRQNVFAPSEVTEPLQHQEKVVRRPGPHQLLQVLDPWEAPAVEVRLHEPRRASRHRVLFFPPGTLITLLILLSSYPPKKNIESNTVEAPSRQDLSKKGGTSGTPLVGFFFFSGILMLHTIGCVYLNG